MATVHTSSTVRSGTVSLSVREHSPAGAGRPTVVLVHGYPDRQEAWDALVSVLPLERWHVVSYDVRGAGGSDAPVRRAGYRTERLVDDLVAVLDEVLGEGEAAHLVGHDWGSVQLWEAVLGADTDPRLRGRVATFTSISGPSLDHAAWLARHSDGRRRALLRQSLHSWYVLAFQVPLLPDLAWRRGHRLFGRLVGGRQRLPRDHWGEGLGDDAAHGLGLYRANLGSTTRRPGHRHTDVPVLVVHPTHDPFITDVFLEDLDHFCGDVRVERVDAGHWVTVTHAREVAALLVEHVDAH
jgi:pimeloyl-ACP methyl ester carboxylesterase